MTNFKFKRNAKTVQYLGIVIFFYTNEHERIHIHARKNEYESKAGIIVINGNIVEIIISNIRGKQPLKGKELKNLKVFLENYADAIVKKWVDYFVYHKDVEFNRITQKL